MSSVSIDIEHHHGHSNRIVDEHHRHSYRIVDDHHHHHRHSIGSNEEHHHHRHSNGSNEEHHHHRHSNGSNEEHHHHHRQSRIVPVTGTPEHEVPVQWEGPESHHEEEKELITLGERLGYEELFDAKVWRSSMAELLGTAAVAFMSDAVTISSYEIGESISRLLIPGIIIPIIVAYLVLVTVPVTGGHINPIVSMSFGLMGRIPLCRAAIYIFVQCIGGILGALALKSIVDGETERNFSLGGCTIIVVTTGPNGPITTGLETSRAFYLEIVMSFVFLFFSRWVAFDAKKSDMFTRLVYCFGIGIGVGFNFFVSRTVTGVEGYSGAGVNPATCFGPAVVRGGNLWHRHWIFWIGPAIGSICFYLYTRIIVLEDVRPNKNKHDFINFVKACHRAIHHK